MKLLTFLRTVPCIVPLLLGTSLCFGQTSNQELLDQINESKKLPGASSDESLSFQPSQDIGTLEIIRKYPKPSTFTVFSAQTFFYTDNLFLTQGNTVDTFAWLGSIGASYVPYSTYRWTPRVTLDGSLMRYSRASRADFDAQTLTLESRLDLNENKTLSWDADISLRRLEGARSGVGEFYKHVEYNSSVSWVKSLTGKQSLFALTSFSLGGRQASPGTEDRLEAAVMASVVYRPCAKFELQPFVRPAFRYYDNDVPGSREDLNLYLGFNAFWKPIRALALGTGVLWTGNYSSRSGRDYDAWLPSATLSGRLEF